MRDTPSNAERAAETVYRPAVVNGRCPACGSPSLFVGSGGYVTCGYAACPDPAAVDELLQVNQKKTGVPSLVETPETKQPGRGIRRPRVGVVEKRGRRAFAAAPPRKKRGRR